VLGAAQADALGAEVPRTRSVLTVVGVRPDPQPSHAIGVREQSVDRTKEVSRLLVGCVQDDFETLREEACHR
jgi:hypothetical protein